MCNALWKLLHATGPAIIKANLRKSFMEWVSKCVPSRSVHRVYGRTVYGEKYQRTSPVGVITNRSIIENI